MGETSIDRSRAQRLMQRAGLDALLLLQPEHVAYAIGVHPGPASLFRRAGAAAALVPSNPSEGIAAVLPDLAAGAVRRGCGASRIDFHTTWVETGMARPHRSDEALREVLGSPVVATRPATFEPMIRLRPRRRAARASEPRSGSHRRGSRLRSGGGRGAARSRLASRGARRRHGCDPAPAHGQDRA